jgi:hypothetical protein
LSFNLCIPANTKYGNPLLLLLMRFEQMDQNKKQHISFYSERFVSSKEATTGSSSPRSVHRPVPTKKKATRERVRYEDDANHSLCVGLGLCPIATDLPFGAERMCHSCCIDGPYFDRRHF